jgi:tetratricopeptide (TPR) repeat protein/CHAT domain-containing protein
MFDCGDGAVKVRRLWRVLALMGFVALVAGIGPLRAQAQPTDDLDALNRQVVQLYQAGKYAEATALAKRSLSVTERKFGPDHPSAATVLNNLAELYRAQGRYAEAEPLMRRALAIDEKNMGPEHPNVAATLNNLAGLLLVSDRLSEAESLYRRALAIDEKSFGPDDPRVITDLTKLVQLLQYANRAREAEPLYKRAIAVSEKTLGPEHPQLSVLLNLAALLSAQQEKYAEAEPLYKRAVAIAEKTLGPEHPNVVVALENLGSLYRTLGRVDEAETAFRRVISILEKTWGADHPRVGKALSQLAVVYEIGGRTADAEPLYKRALIIDETRLGLEHPDVARDLNNLASLFIGQSRYGDAKPLYSRALSIIERQPTPLPSTLVTALNNLALTCRALQQYEEAESLFQRAIRVAEASLRSNDPILGTLLNNLADLYEVQGRFADAVSVARRSQTIIETQLGPMHPNLIGPLSLQAEHLNAEATYRRVINIIEKSFGPEHPQAATAFNSLAVLAIKRRNWAQAADYLRRATEVIERRTERGFAGSDGSTKGEAVRVGSYFSGLIKATERIAPAGNADRAQQGQSVFEKAQWVQATEAAVSLTQMAARSAKGDSALAKLVRERQDLVGEWQVKDKQLIAAKSRLPAERSLDAEKVLNDRLGAIDARLKVIDEQFATDFPEYASLASPKPASVGEVQTLLQPNEALVLFLDTPEWKPIPEETFIWVITKGDMHWVRSELGTKKLTERVMALRCGLDAALWDDKEASTRCRETLKATPERDLFGNVRVETLPFDLAGAHELYRALLGSAEDVIKDKHLLIVPSGPLTSLPFNVLVTKPPKVAMARDLADHRGAAWLGTRVSMTVLPSVASLKALRQFTRTSHASKPYLGVGNPLLDGPQDDKQWGAYYKEQAKLARTKRCSPIAAPQQFASARGPRTVLGFASAFRGTHTDIEDVRSWAPLPETADELCEVGRRLGVSESEILLGADATEARLKDYSERGRLAVYTIVHFATHGALTGQVQGSAEPGLILTPPPKGTSDPKALERDDGFLTASEIATLKLDADWVILSACNTAGPQGEGAEALSGMARAFFYAGARALLVSHWEVGSNAAVKLTTRAVAELKAHPEIGRAEAFRGSMKELIEKGSLAEAHPSQWAPFVVVGEGGSER